ncbi:MAG TPA: hypothetical protein GX702_11480 [Chloroflexi bacterium]|nr:hypothetical protein [Chloroflexota bacterium]
MHNRHSSLQIEFLTWSPDGHSVLVYGFDGPEWAETLWRIDLETGECVAMRRNVMLVQSASYSPDGDEFAYAYKDPATDISRLLLTRADGTDERLLYQVEG